MKWGGYLIVTVGILMIAISCKEKTYTPKPRGYMRIDFPEKAYQKYEGDCPYTFEYPVYGRIEQDNMNADEPCWFNISFPAYDGKIHLTYKAVQNNLSEYMEDSRTLVYKHTIKADAIEENTYHFQDRDVYGILYDIKGNAASSVQFFLTDSNRNFIRGSLYFNVEPDKDSMAPVINFFREDIIHFINTFEWRK
ncbi:MAG: gliding motility lipoprotein GldD [Bacteroidales bacterium]|nr:gliding motility lipoprotein GldD [Bacteroidales bacterium]